MKHPWVIRSLILLLTAGWLVVTSCSSTKYYDRYPKNKECKVKKNKTKGWKK